MNKADLQKRVANHLNLEEVKARELAAFEVLRNIEARKALEQDAIKQSPLTTPVYEEITNYKVVIKGVGELSISKGVFELMDTAKSLKVYFETKGVEIDSNTAYIAYGKLKEAICSSV
ncbi:hypothetical protein [Shewanella polaris]|uniref:Uncharacterized protein n=1 Tax=Shewanella polaris TaxID=2588449 RepID=A0A4Y5YGM9_9GAMM|nr:hypothetical protein [Shewanella polaris]QDE31689.1 hypothetical protein FH971_12360 [Shewanella polaris]